MTRFKIGTLSRVRKYHRAIKIQDSSSKDNGDHTNVPLQRLDPRQALQPIVTARKIEPVCPFW